MRILLHADIRLILLARYDLFCIVASSELRLIAGIGVSEACCYQRFGFSACRDDMPHADNSTVAHVSE